MGSEARVWKLTAGVDSDASVFFSVIGHSHPSFMSVSLLFLIDVEEIMPASGVSRARECLGCGFEVE